MSFAQSVLAPWALIFTSLLSLGVVVWALWRRPWQVLLEDAALQHRWLGATLAVANAASRLYGIDDTRV